MQKGLVSFVCSGSQGLLLVTASIQAYKAGARTK